MNDSKLDKVLEGYKPIPMKRLFYPRGMQLSEQFVNAFHREYDRLIGEGINPKTLVERFGKAMAFHVNDPRKYKLLDEEQAGIVETSHTDKKKDKTKSRRAGKKEVKAQVDEDQPEKKQSSYTSPDTDSGITQS